MRGGGRKETGSCRGEKTDEPVRSVLRGERMGEDVPVEEILLESEPSSRVLTVIFEL